MTSPPPARSLLFALAALLALIHGLMAACSKLGNSMTADEIAHLAGGYTYNCWNDFRLQPENGNLPQRVAALPLTWQHGADTLANESRQRGDVWEYGHELFYGRGVSTDEVVFWGRAMIALFSAATALLIFSWARDLFGWRGGFVSLTLYVFSPSFLAHGALATSDVVMTFFFLACVRSWWTFLNEPDVRTTVICGLCLGLACVAKFSALLLLPIYAVCFAVRLARTSTVSLPWGARITAGILVQIGVGCAIIWMFYDWRFAAFSPELGSGRFYRGDFDAMLHGLGLLEKPISWLREWRALPEAFLYGLAFVIQFSRERAAFLVGDYSTTGWWYFFPLSFLIKSTLPFLVLLVAGVASGALVLIRRSAFSSYQRLWSIVPLLVLFTVYWVTSIASNLNIGHRHILPTYAVLFILCGSFGRWLRHDKKLPGIFVAICLGWHAFESVRNWPNYIPYFNQLAGGPSNGWRLLVDSSLDWGQDLPGLKKWLDQNARGNRVFLSYFGAGDPKYEGIHATMLPTLPAVGRQRPWYSLQAGCYAISATMLQHVYSRIRGPWTVEFEREYQQVRQMEPSLLAYQNDPSQRAKLLSEAPAENWEIAWKRYDQLRFARLCYYLRVRSPDAMIGYSILVYRLSNDELTAATGESLDQWEAAIKKARAASATP